MNETVRTHVVLPKELVEEVDRLVGPRHRSEFLAEAIAEKLRHERLMHVARRVAGSLADVAIPGWETPESTVEWVRRRRALDIRQPEEE
ncbi:MAG TPA: ribbon-helix-helix domain-containing protein [Thermomicrobiaceae bacterium]|nr:ribbon-helix-helix domain-containing protein [Thermomicrobiaceae bacterium]